MSNKLSSRFLNKQKAAEVIISKDLTANENTSDKAEEIETPLDSGFQADMAEMLKKLLDEKIQSTPIWFDYSKEQQHELIKKFVSSKIESCNIDFSENEKHDLIENLYNSLSDFGAIQYLLDNEKVESVVINGVQSVYITIGNKILNTETNLNKNQLEYLVNSLKHAAHKENFNEIDKFSFDNYKITVISEQISKNGINIRIDKTHEHNNKYLIKNNILTNEVLDFVLSLMNLRKNIVISGDTNTSKTNFLEILLTNLSDKRVCLLEAQSQISSNFGSLSKFISTPESEYFSDLVSEIQKLKPEYFVSDLNTIKPNIVQKNGSILTLRARTVENALKSLIGSHMADGLPEKFAKTRVLEDIDYIIHLEKDDFEKISLSTIVELTPAKTIQASVKTVVKLTNGKYITDIPQPLTSMRARNLRTKK